LSNIASEIPKLNNDSLQKALDDILQKGSTMIDLVAQEPQSLRQTRAFFVEHMSSVIGVLQAYTTLESQKVDQKLEQKLYTLVNDVSQRFSQEIEKLTYAKTNASTQENATKE
jgi:5-bromo-4-chloroindolyl phosphate hydrolysis protein